MPLHHSFSLAAFFSLLLCSMVPLSAPLYTELSSAFAFLLENQICEKSSAKKSKGKKDSAVVLELVLQSRT